MPSIGLRAVLHGPGDLLRATLDARGERSSVTIDFFVYPEEIREFGAGLVSFPVSRDHQVTFEYGRPETWFSFLRLRVFLVRPNGSSAIEVTYDNLQSLPSKASGLLYLPCYPATVNSLGSALVNWSVNTDRELLHEWADT